MTDLVAAGIVEGLAGRTGGYRLARPAASISLLDVIGCIEHTLGAPVDMRFGEWRPGDQWYFVSDTRRAAAELGLRPALPWRQGIAVLAASYAEERRDASPRITVGAA